MHKLFFLLIMIIFLASGIAAQEIPEPNDAIGDSDNFQPEQEQVLQEQILQLEDQILQMHADISVLSQRIESHQKEIDTLKGVTGADEKPSKKAVSYTLIIAGITIITTVIVVYIARKNKNDRINKLREYVRLHASRGHHPANIKHFLLNRGYKKDELDKVFSRI